MGTACRPPGRRRQRAAALLNFRACENLSADISGYLVGTSLARGGERGAMRNLALILAVPVRRLSAVSLPQSLVDETSRR